MRVNQDYHDRLHIAASCGRRVNATANRSATVTFVRLTPSDQDN